MRRVALAAAFLVALASSGSAQMIIGGVGGGGGGGLAVNQPAADCTASSILYADASKNIKCNAFIFNPSGGASAALFERGSSGAAAMATILGEGVSAGGVSAANAGVAGLGVRDSGTYTYGVYGGSRSGGTNRFGGYFSLSVNNVVDPQTGVAALAADNANVAANILELRDNATSIFTVQDGGAAWSMMANKSLTDATIATFVRVAVTSGAAQGGLIRYCGFGSSATPHVQTRCGTASFSVINNAGTEVCAVGTPADVVAVSTGTLTVVFATDTSPTNACDLRVTVDSSLNSTVSFSYSILLFGAATTTVTPQ